MGKGERSSIETKANHVSISPQEDRSSAEETVGEGEGAEKGGVVHAAQVITEDGAEPRLKT
jgi:hypothetical protein